jgi:hypothetical protein
VQGAVADTHEAPRGQEEYPPDPREYIRVITDGTPDWEADADVLALCDAVGDCERATATISAARSHVLAICRILKAPEPTR